MRKIIWIWGLVLAGLSAMADDLKVAAEWKSLSAGEQRAEVEVSLTWENSWRNACNRDAVYLFCKYATADNGPWKHLFIDTTEGAQTISDGFTAEVMNEGRGLLVYRTTAGQGKSEITLQLRYLWTEAETDPEKVHLAMQGIEMVYIPAGPFYAGGGTAANAFRSPHFGAIPAESDLIGSGTAFAYAASSGTAAYAANRTTNEWATTTGAFPAWWRVDFKTPKTIRYFGVAGVYRKESLPAPLTVWYLEGSETAADGTWVELWSGTGDDWSATGDVYPVQHAIAVTSPGAYRYYRLRFLDSQGASLENNIRIYNVAMTETDLSFDGENAPVVLNGFVSPLPARYPDGVQGFYAMKYELTQEQFVTYLNQLPRSAQYAYLNGELIRNLEGEKYVYGDTPDAPSARNGITVTERGEGLPYLFACNLNAGSAPNALDDGQTLACNYLSPADMLAYADWSGLRPMSELEYEKMCRGQYPAVPAQVDYPWGETAPVTGSDYVRTGTGQESATGNVNAANGLEGPARAGIFVRAGAGRISAGSSLYGVSDLAGNVSEMYANVMTWGKYMNRSLHGSGAVNFRGAHTTDWPGKPQAWGVRGGSFQSDVAELQTADRSGMENYFDSLTQRRPEVGVRLGISAGAAVALAGCSLTLENEQTTADAATIVYDTVCDGSEYVIQGDATDEETCVYLWFRSTDNGTSWKILEGETRAGLRVTNLTDEVEANVKKTFLYKRIVYARDGMAENTVGLLIAHGAQPSRLLDKITATGSSVSGISVTTPLPARFEWTMLQSGKELYVSTKDEVTSSYRVTVGDIHTGDEWLTGIYTIVVKIKMAGRCTSYQKLEVQALP